MNSTSGHYCFHPQYNSHNVYKYKHLIPELGKTSTAKQRGRKNPDPDLELWSHPCSVLTALYSMEMAFAQQTSGDARDEAELLLRGSYQDLILLDEERQLNLY